MTDAKALAAQLGAQYISPEVMAGLLADADEESRPRSRSRYGRPTPVMEPAPASWNDTGQEIMIDRFDSNPAVSFIRQLMPGFRFVGPPPTMFSTGDLPLFTASGIDPAELWFVPWVLRHTAALSADSRLALLCVEEGDTPDLLQTNEGWSALGQYLLRVWIWAIKPPPPKKLTDEEYQALFPPERALGQGGDGDP